jgi:2-oxoglutarate ferredoxin oxidoreductase subunit alpha
MSAYGGPHLLRFTTSTHDERGYLTKVPSKVERLNRHLIDKVMRHQDEIDLVRENCQQGASVLLISYGITARAMDEAVREARLRGCRVSALTLLSLWPLPERAISQAIASLTIEATDERGDTIGGARVVVAELNDGQLRREVERLACGTTVHPSEGKAPPRAIEVLGAHRLDGELITPQQILERGGLR